jgi:hypothetical protein
MTAEDLVRSLFNYEIPRDMLFNVILPNGKQGAIFLELCRRKSDRKFILGTVLNDNVDFPEEHHIDTLDKLKRLFLAKKVKPSDEIELEDEDGNIFSTGSQHIELLSKDTETNYSYIKFTY